MARPLEDQQYTEEHSKGAWKKILVTAFKHKQVLTVMLIAVLMTVALNIALPILNSYAIKHYFENTNPNRFDNVGLIFGVYIAMGIGYFVSIFLYVRAAGIMEARVSYDLRKEAYEKLQKLSFSYFDRTAQGWIMARMTSDARTLSNIISWGFVDMLWGLLFMLSIMIVLLIFNPLIALIIIVSTPIMLGFAILVRKKVLFYYRNAKKINSEVTASFNESFLGSKTTKSLVIEDQNKLEFNEKVGNYRKQSLRAARISATFGPVIFILGYLAVATILYTGGKIILDDVKIFGKVMTVSSLYLFVDYAIQYFDPVMQVSRVIGDFQQAQASAERIVSLIEQEVEIVDTPEVIEKYGTVFEPKLENYEEIIGELEFKDVTFKYSYGEEVLKDFNLKIKAGQSVAIVGHTGSGKSTIVNLISRFYEPTKGSILIDGTDYRERSIGWLHSNLGYVLQSPQLFSGTIKENIRYGRLDATDDDVIEAAKMANAHNFISSLEDGYDSEVGESGNRLSLGERQLISFARAIIANPRILVLDEATSSIDTKAELIIQESISRILEGRTSFVIAHRLSTVVNCDLILVLDKGIVVESGTHHELLTKRGYYFELYLNQFKKEKEQSLIY